MPHHNSNPQMSDMAVNLRHVGKPIKHDSAELHVSGAARYIDDIPEPADILHVVPGGHLQAVCGSIKLVDLEAVRNAPGVVDVLVASDIPGVNDVSPILGDDPVLASDFVRFHGDVIFAVVAETRDMALRAARLANIVIEENQPVITIKEALESNSRVLDDYAFVKGKGAKALEDAGEVLTGAFSIGGQDHFYLEGQISLAVPQENGDMLVHCSTQHPSEVQHLVAKVLGKADHAITVECRRMGGGFGGKETQASQWAALAALAAARSGRACKMRLDRDADMQLTGKRHEFDVSYRVGHTPDGVLESIDVDFASRCGCSADLSGSINDRTMFHADNCYDVPHAAIKTRRMKTNTVSNTAFRGFGGPQGMLFAERMMDHIAISTGVDPLDVRKRNFYSADGTGVTPYGMAVEDCIIADLVETLEKTSDYRRRRENISAYNSKNTILKKGISLTPVKFGISFTATHLNQAGALVHVYSDGSIQLNHGGTEMGQGLYIKIAQIVADVFGVDVERIRVTATNTSRVPNTSATAASSGADLNGMAAYNAAMKIIQRLKNFLAERHNCAGQDIVFANNIVRVDGEEFAFNSIVGDAYLDRVSLSSTGFYKTPKITWDRDKGTGRPFYYFAYGAAVSEVTIDTLTGEMIVDRIDILHDAGKSLNPAIDIGQIEGGFVQGMGWLTTEELVYDDAGHLKTHAPSTYKIPCANDVPEDFRVALYQPGENREPTIHRSKAVGEPPLMLANSVFCAISDAILATCPGTLPQLDAPATPQNILAALRIARKNGQN